MNKLRRDFDLKVDYMANDTEFEGKKKKTIYFKNIDDALETYGAYMARKKDQVNTLAKKHGLELTGDEQDYWMYAAYNAGSGNVDKLMKKVKSEGMSPDYTNKVWDSEWETVLGNATARFQYGKRVDASADETYLLPSVQVKAQSETPEAKKKRSRGIYNMHDGSNKSSNLVTRLTK